MTTLSATPTEHEAIFEMLKIKPPQLWQGLPDYMLELLRAIPREKLLELVTEKNIFRSQPPMNPRTGEIEGMDLVFTGDRDTTEEWMHDFGQVGATYKVFERNG